jgi:hypothetical protein
VHSICCRNHFPFIFLRLHRAFSHIRIWFQTVRDWR